MVFVGTMGVQCIIEQLDIINHDETLFKKIFHDMIKLNLLSVIRKVCK